MKNMTEKQQSRVFSAAKIPEVYQKDIDEWLKQGNSVYNLRLMEEESSEFLIAWNESSILILESNHRKMLSKWTLDGDKDYALSLHCDSRHCTLAMIWSEHKELRKLNFSVECGYLSEMLPIINILLHRLPYQVDILRDDETDDAVLQEKSVYKKYHEFLDCFCDPVLDSYWDRKSGIDYFFGVSVDGITAAIFQDESDVQIFYFPWKIISSLSYKARKIRIGTILENSYLLPVSFSKRKEAKRISDSYSDLIHLLL